MKFVYEFIGTFFLVFTVGMTVLGPNSAGNFAPLAIGSVLAVMVYAGAHLSGAHYNPAVSLAVFLRGKISFINMSFYWLAQFIAALFAALLVIYFKGAPSPTSLELFVWKGLIAEFLFTFALCFVVLNVATVKENKGNSFYGFAIGFIVLVGAYAIGTISGGAFNPAVALGLSIMNLSAWNNLWVFLVGNFLGAACAALIFNLAYTKHEKKLN